MYVFIYIKNEVASTVNIQSTSREYTLSLKRIVLRG